jgi:glycosyltransferase involved in cell wall biosynthesis
MIAVLFHRLGPYHQARLRAASALMPLVAVQGCTMDRTYAWAHVEGDPGFPVETLFDDGDSDDRGSGEIITRIASVLDRVQPKVVVIPGWSANIALCALTWCRENQVPAVVMSDSTAWDLEQRPWWRETIKRRLLCGFSSALVAGTPHAAYMRQLGMPEDRIFLGYDAVDNVYFESRTSNSGGRNENLIGAGGSPKRHFIVSARFIPEKNLHSLINAYQCYQDACATRRVKDEGLTAWDLVIIGDGPLRESVLEDRSALGLEESIHLEGFRQYDELPDFYAAASCLILPSISETWGLVVNEAMASGLPVLVSNRCGCAQDLVQDGINGYTFDPYDVEQLAQLMHRLTEAPKHRLSEMGDASRAIIADWGPERFASGLKQALECALEVGPKRASLLQRMILKVLLWR